MNPREFVTPDDTLHSRDIFIDVNADDFKPPLAILVVLLTKVRELGSTRLAPGGPKIDKNNFSARTPGETG